MYYLWSDLSAAVLWAPTVTPQRVQRRPCPGARRIYAEGDRPHGRRSANYQPNFWNYSSIESLAGKHNHNLMDPSGIDKLKFHIRRQLMDEAEELSKLRVIDTIQRLGVAYHFDEEIGVVLNSILMETVEVDGSMDDVHITTLLFRLLRQNNSPASTDILLRSLKDETGRFKKTLHEDIEGLLSLYEASHLAFEGENLLDEARIFTTNALHELTSSLHPFLHSSVAKALAIPLHWMAPRLQARWFIGHYARDTEADQPMLHFAKLDFNSVQNLHRQELIGIARWWKNANLSERLPFARDRLIECFYFAIGIVSEPGFGACREVIAKIFSLFLLLDDIYDVYGTLDELVAFTNTIKSWEEIGCQELPDYMKAIYLTIYNISNEVADHMFKQDGCDARVLLKKAWHDLCEAFLLEASWHHNNYKPTLQEYLDNGWVSASAPLLLLHAFTTLKVEITPNSMKQLESYPSLVQTVSKIVRLSNDLATHSDELKRGDAPSSVGIYMFENRATEHDARKAMRDLITETWKLVNHDAFNNCQYPFSFANACVNMARMTHCLYHGGDGLGAPDDKKNREIREILLEPLKMGNKGMPL